jgi:hypothetical protein
VSVDREAIGRVAFNRLKPARNPQPSKRKRKGLPVRAFAQRAAVPLGVLAFWGGMLMAARGYPSEYDWRYITISSLVYPDRNPNGHLWASGGVALCGLAGVSWTAGLLRKGRQPGVARWRIGICALGLGYGCMVGCALLPEGVLGIPKSHEVLALAAFMSLCIGLVHSTFKAVARSARLRASPGSLRLRAGLLAGFVLSPIVLAAVAQIYVATALPQLPWVNLAWRARGVATYLSFSFWEWVTCAVFSVYMVALSRSPRSLIVGQEGGS